MPASSRAEKPVGDHLSGRRALPEDRQRRLARLQHTCYTPRLRRGRPLRTERSWGIV